MKQILYFSAGWCGPCRQLSPLMESLKGQINYEKVDVDKQQDLSMKYNIRNIPTLILLENGEVKDRTVGNQTPQSILKFYNG
tara:strand:- start:54 stop:299 length:246 start_codon:yes stop_codon:yes gene_type:complete